MKRILALFISAILAILAVGCTPDDDRLDSTDEETNAPVQNRTLPSTSSSLEADDNTMEEGSQLKQENADQAIDNDSDYLHANTPQPNSTHVHDNSSTDSGGSGVKDAEPFQGNAD